MKICYDDILSRLGSPIWWDDNGTPRYDSFHPRYMMPYADEAALFKVACQRCDMVYTVATYYYRLDYADGGKSLSERLKKYGELGYGDPPDPLEQCCASGYCTTTVFKEVLELWSRDNNRKWVKVDFAPLIREYKDGNGYVPVELD